MKRKPANRGSTLTAPLPARFDLHRAVCSYGFYMLEPNRWDSDTEMFHRTLRIDDDNLVELRITQPEARLLRIRCDRSLTAGERQTVRDAVGRMLRLDEDFTGFHRLHSEAKRKKFGRLLRSPTLFEDIVRTITCCNVAWRNTQSMNALLCSEVGGGAFPTAKQLAAVDPDELKQRCRVGYRAVSIHRLAEEVATGRRDLAALEDASMSTLEVYRALRQIHGLGDYAASNLCMLLGRYDRIAIDSETYRHFREAHQMPTPDNPKHLHPHIEAYYARYAPFQFLAYWYELWFGYGFSEG